jgi:beta-lactamase superfamily II metal-dependent hydrolase
MMNREVEMEEKLVVRVYDVGFGDCIYVRIPDGEKFFNVVIDCGSKDTIQGGQKPTDAIDHIISKLPKEADGKKHIHLLVVTHPHFDHINGFEKKRFEKAAIDRIWLPVFMNPDHEQAEKAQAFQDAADDEARLLLNRSGLKLSQEAQELLLRSVSNVTALKNLRENFAESNGINELYPLYISRDMGKESKKGKIDLDRYDFQIVKGVATFCGFNDSNTHLRVLAPEWNIDKYYLGRITEDYKSLVHMNALRLSAYHEGVAELEPEIVSDSSKTDEILDTLPQNISEKEFRALQNRMLYSVLEFTEEEGHLKNNTSVVLLLEWRGRRLLFTGDAEWDGKGLEEERKNCCWDVMYGIPEVKNVLLNPLDYFKVSHHGSINGTPFEKQGFQKIVKKMVIPGKTEVVVSTKWGTHNKKNPIPNVNIMKDLGSLAKNKRKYPNDPDDKLQNEYQPQRTDQEPDPPDDTARYVEVAFAPAD